MASIKLPKELVDEQAIELFKEKLIELTAVSKDNFNCDLVGDHYVITVKDTASETAYYEALAYTHGFILGIEVAVPKIQELAKIACM